MRKIILRVTHEGEILVSAPKTTPKSFIQSFVDAKHDWIRHQITLFSGSKRLMHKTHDQTTKRKLYEKARAISEELIAKYNSHYKFSLGKVTIRDQSTRWGSCSSKGNLNFNYRLALLPERLQEYLVVHELCHLKHMNHGKEFWGAVAQTIPDVEKRKNELRSV